MSKTKSEKGKVTYLIRQRDSHHATEIFLFGAVTIKLFGVGIIPAVYRTLFVPEKDAPLTDREWNALMLEALKWGGALLVIGVTVAMVEAVDSQAALVYATMLLFFLLMSDWATIYQFLRTL